MKTIIAVITVLALSGLASATEPATQDVQRNFNVEKGGRLVVVVNGGDLQVKVWDKMQVQLTARNIGDDADRLQATQDGNTVRVEYKTRWGWAGSNKGLRFEFFVPQDFNVDLSTSGGDVSVSGDLAGAATMRTSGGDLTIDGVTGDVDGKTSGGDITVRNAGGNAELATSGGDIKVDRASKDLKVVTSGGDVTVGTVKGSLNASTSGGDMSISKVGGDLSASTSSGDVTVGDVSGNVSLSTAGGDIALGSGKGAISAKTSGGDVSIKRVVGYADVSSAGGTVKVGLIPEGNESSRIESSGGDVYLYLPTDSKATIKAVVSGGEDDQITTDFPVTYTPSREHGTHRMEFNVNGGGPVISLRTSSGSIYVKKLTDSAK